LPCSGESVADLPQSCRIKVARIGAQPFGEELMRFELKSMLAAGCLLAASALSAAAFEAVTVEPAELREGPAWEFAPIVDLPPGSIVEVLNCDRRWCEVGIEDYDGFLPRGVLDLGTYQPPIYLFPPLIAQPSLWHGRYYSRDHYRYESRARWRDREGRRIYVLPGRVQPRPLPPPLIRRVRPGEPVRPGVVPGGPQRRDIQQPRDRATPRPGQPPAPRVMPPQQTQPRPQPGQIQPQPRPQVQPRPQPAPVQRQAPPPGAPRAAPAPAPQRAVPPPAEKQKQKQKQPGTQ
jgi:hypothetical protein